MQNSHRAWLISALVAAIIFIGAVASNLIASELATTFRTYRAVIWLTFVIALVVTVTTAIVEARRKNHTSVAKAAADDAWLVNG